MANERAPVVATASARAAGSQAQPPADRHPSSARPRADGARATPEERRAKLPPGTDDTGTAEPSDGRGAGDGSVPPGYTTGRGTPVTPDARADGTGGADDDGDGQAAGDEPAGHPAREDDQKPAASLAQRAAATVRGHAVDAGRVAARAMSNAWRDRVLGLAAEAGFWQLLSLPPLLLTLLGSIGYIGDAIGSNAVNSIRNSLLRGADDLLTDEVVNDVVRPTVDQILTHGRPDVISIGFVLALWTGSTAMATYVNTITIAYGQRDLRSAVRSRLLALRLFLVQVLTGVILLPALVLGPDLLAELLRAKRHPVVKVLLELAFWPVVAVLALAVLTSLYHQALPRRRPWRRALPGALFALVGWLIGSYLLRLYVERVFGNELIYGSLAAPAAALLFFYITALAVLLGAELNAALDQRRPGAVVTGTTASAAGPGNAAGAGDAAGSGNAGGTANTGSAGPGSQYVQDDASEG
jgi:membrane protein